MLIKPLILSAAAYVTDKAEAVVDSKIAPVPPILMSGATFAGLSLQDWQYIVMIIYTALLIVGLLWKWARSWGRK